MSSRRVGPRSVSTSHSEGSTGAETRAGLEAGAEGVGLLRTELTFLEANEWPDEDAHAAVLGPILALLDGKRAIVRVLDFGGDKVPPFLWPRRSAPRFVPVVKRRSGS